jgi:hypothetical protein
VAWAGEPEVAGRQGGVFTAEQAISQGWSPRQVQRRRSAGGWRRVLGDGLTARRGDVDVPARGWAVHLTWPDAVLAGPTAALLHRLPVPGTDDVWVRGPRIRARGVAGLPGSIDPASHATVDGLPVTSLRASVLDSLVVLPDEAAYDLVAWVFSRGLVDRTDLREATLERFGQRGVCRLQTVVRITSGGAVNRGEGQLHEILRGGGIDGWRAGVAVRDAGGIIAVVDILFDLVRLVIELDGRRAHSDRAAFENDRRRQNRLVNAGFTVLRFTWADLTERPESVVHEVRAALARLA